MSDTTSTTPPTADELRKAQGKIEQLERIGARQAEQLEAVTRERNALDAEGRALREQFKAAEGAIVRTVGERDQARHQAQSLGESLAAEAKKSAAMAGQAAARIAELGKELAAAGTTNVELGGALAKARDLAARRGAAVGTIVKVVGQVLEVARPLVDEE